MDNLRQPSFGIKATRVITTAIPYCLDWELSNVLLQIQTTMVPTPPTRFIFMDLVSPLFPQLSPTQLNAGLSQSRASHSLTEAHEGESKRQPSVYAPS